MGNSWTSIFPNTREWEQKEWNKMRETKKVRREEWVWKEVKSSMARSLLYIGESTTIECGVNYQYLQQYTEVAQCGTPSCSRPQPATENGVRDGRSNLLVALPTFMGSMPWAPRINRGLDKWSRACQRRFANCFQKNNSTQSRVAALSYSEQFEIETRLF